MVNIIFEAHSTTFDNEAHLSSGHFDVELSPLGAQQANGLGERYKDQEFDAIFCSDLQRSYKTAEIAFGNRFPIIDVDYNSPFGRIIKDKRLRECDYGDLTRHPSVEVEPLKVEYITKPFPNGESYEQVSQRMKAFLDELKKKYEGKKIMIIGHRATQYGLEHWIKGVSIKDAITVSFKWQPGWTYSI